MRRPAGWCAALAAFALLGTAGTLVTARADGHAGASQQAPAPAAAPPHTVLATGDSMIQLVDRYLARRLEPGGRAKVHSDSRIGTGISKPALLNWPRHAASQARQLHPRATVVFLGANDGFNVRSASRRLARCCGRAWSREYGRRARRMMVSYSQAGAGRVYWLLLPQARAGFFRRVYPAVNKGLRQAARGLTGVRLIHLNRVFTPGGRYRKFMRYRGRRVRVRQGDGIHLSLTGASIAASLVVRRITTDRALADR
ncbi:MAG TPA: hypothetical protein VGV10_02095 [Thermoleophilaceae bacterium]|nr:hypothetical protein [Thermoleophilaceae bacterium]